MSEVSQRTRVRRLADSVLPGRTVGGYANLIEARLRKLAAVGSTGMLPMSGHGDGAIFFRGGQVVYSHGDLVVCAPVNAGAQVIADGHIHIYGRLRGRALAGARGNVDARVFCQCLEAELIAVAGEFLTADDIPKELLGRPAQVYLENGAVKVAPL